MRDAARAVWRAILCLLVLACAPFACAAAEGDLVAVPPLGGRVTDLSGTLDGAQRAQLEQQLAGLGRETGSEVAILIVPTTRPESIEQYSIRVADAWKPGRAKVWDGALIVVAKNDRRSRIEVGHGLEGAIPDAMAKRIISETLAPRFRADDFAGGLSAAVTQMQKLIEGESLPAPKAAERPAGGFEGNIEHLLVIGITLSVVAGSILRAIFGRLFGSMLAGGLVGGAGWFITGSLLVAGIGGLIAFVFVLAISTGAGRGVRNGGDWGSSSGGSWGGGSWGGGSDSWSSGGGSFGGGGASGDW